PAEQAAVAFVLGALRDPSAAPALAGLLDGPAAVAEAARQGLRRLGPSADDRVLQGVRTGDSAARRALLPLVAGAGAVADLVACRADPAPDVRALACDALARCGATGAVGALFPLLAEANPRVSFAALAAIQSLGSAETEALARAAAASSDPRMRRAAMRILT